ncbi:MAG: branched-chain amino acid ABC transporter permease [Burkholderiaceae bacterium]|jgi:branched-chain amino acid transport system permease protein|nr:MAG: branched-chain amino acid ABC transporter permease [Burkholderiaceae bacterium]
MPTKPRRSAARNHLLVWGGFALLLIVAPQIFHSGLGVNMLSQMGYLIIICLSYNMQLGQGGLLSFCHAIYAGTGGFAAAYAVNYVSGADLGLPLVFIPIVGGITGALLAVPLGYISTKKAGVTFAMITLGIGEMIVAIAVMLPGIFGGDAGMSIDRVYGKPFLGFTFGPQIQVYYLIAFYCFVCTVLMYAFTGTPLGRMLNAVRDNPERVGFIGYNTQRVRWYAFIISSFFAGIGGALATINVEIVNATDALGSVASGSYLLFTFLGGVTVFYGPILGAILMVLAYVLLADLTSAWLLYLGLAFLIMVMFVPGGVGSLVAANVRMARFGKLRRFAGFYGALLAAGVVMLIGVSAMIEMIYHLQLNAASGAYISFMGLRLDTTHAAAWAGAIAVAVGGGAVLRWVGKRYARTWGVALEEIESEMAQRAGAAA